MANYVVTTRGKDGSLVERAYTANDRSDLFKQLAADGVTAVRVREGTIGKKPRTASVGGAPSKGRGLIAAAIVILGVGAAVWYLMPGGEKKPVKVDKAVKAKTVVPIEKSPETNKVKVVEKVKKTEEYPPLEPGQSRAVKWVRPANWDQLSRAQKTRIQPVARVIKPIGWDGRNLFKTISDKKIERLMRIRPGQMFVGTVRYDERFVKNFLDSLKVPIDFSEDDSPEDRALKQAVIDSRADLKAAYDRGEDIVKIMNDTEDQLRELATYRMNLKKLVVEQKMSGENSEQDMKDCIDATNKILVENGMEPFKFGNLWFRKSQYEMSTTTKDNK